MNNQEPLNKENGGKKKKKNVLPTTLFLHKKFNFYFQHSELWMYLHKHQQVPCLECRNHFNVSDQITYLAINHLIQSVVCALYILI